MSKVRKQAVHSLEAQRSLYGAFIEQCAQRIDELFSKGAAMCPACVVLDGRQGPAAMVPADRKTIESSRGSLLCKRHLQESGYEMTVEEEYILKFKTLTLPTIAGSSADELAQKTGVRANTLRLDPFVIAGRNIRRALAEGWARVAIGREFSVEEIADELSMSPTTVRTFLAEPSGRALDGLDLLRIWRDEDEDGSLGVEIDEAMAALTDAI
jgi:hypothetical protein